ncbi:hypothetical protein L3Y34_009418 [Caenorhabditis briggsae]|nr:hypothetical protein L3Y34_009418 [Caenorhabditis briggsae]
MTTWISFFNLKTNTIAPEELGLDEAPNIILTGSLIYYSTITVFVQLAITAFLVLLTYIWLRDVLLNYSLRMGAVTSDTKKLNRVLVKIITFQVFLPIFIFTGVTIFALQYSGWVQQEYLDYMISLVFMCSPILSPFSYMLFVPHYRNFFAIKRERTDSLALEHRRDSSMKRTVVSITTGTFAN